LLAAASTPTTPLCRMSIPYEFLEDGTPRKGCEELLQKFITRISDEVSSYGSCSHMGELLVGLIRATQGSEALALQYVPMNSAFHTPPMVRC
jgi:hypothetical protein